MCQQRKKYLHDSPQPFSVVDFSYPGENSLALLSLRSRVCPLHLNLGILTAVTNRTGQKWLCQFPVLGLEKQAVSPFCTDTLSLPYCSGYVEIFQSWLSPGLQSFPPRRQTCNEAILDSLDQPIPTWIPPVTTTDTMWDKGIIQQSPTQIPDLHNCGIWWSGCGFQSLRLR